MGVTVVTATYGGFDAPLAQVEQDSEVRWLCYTDDPKLEVVEPWDKVIEPPRFKHPCLAAKVHKMLPDSHPSIWVDANIEITSPSFAREALGAVNDGLALYRHPRRDCIYEEAEASLGSEAQNGKYAHLPLLEQVDSYRAGRHPEHGGLFACGIIAWDHPDPRLGPLWLAECSRWSYQDQLSFPVVTRRLGITPGVFDHPQIERRRPVLSNRWLSIHPHL